MTESEIGRYWGRCRTCNHQSGGLQVPVAGPHVVEARCPNCGQLSYFDVLGPDEIPVDAAPAQPDAQPPAGDGDSPPALTLVGV